MQRFCILALFFVLFGIIQTSQASLLEKVKQSEMGKNLLNLIQAKKIVGDEMDDIKQIIQEMTNQFKQKLQKMKQFDLDQKEICEHQMMSQNQIISENQEIISNQEKRLTQLQKELDELQNGENVKLNKLNQKDQELEKQQKQKETISSDIVQKINNLEKAINYMQTSIVYIEDSIESENEKEINENFKLAYQLMQSNIRQDILSKYASKLQSLQQITISENDEINFQLIQTIYDLKQVLIQEMEYNNQLLKSEDQKIDPNIKKIEQDSKNKLVEDDDKKKEIIRLKQRELEETKNYKDQIQAFIKESQDTLQENKNYCKEEQNKRDINLKELEQESEAIQNIQEHFHQNIYTSTNYVKQLIVEKKEESGAIIKDICINANENEYIQLSCQCKAGQLGMILQYNLSDFGTAPLCTSTTDFTNDPTCTFDFEYKQQTCLGAEFCRFNCRFLSFTNTCGGRQRMCKINYKCKCE